MYCVSTSPLAPSEGQQLQRVFNLQLILELDGCFDATLNWEQGPGSD